MITLLLSLALLFLTLLTTTFHLPNLSLFFLLVIWLFRTKDFALLVVVEAVLFFLFGYLSLGTSLLLLTIMVGLYLLGRENILPGRKTGSFLLAFTMVVVWEILNNLLV